MDVQRATASIAPLLRESRQESKQSAVQPTAPQNWRMNRGNFVPKNSQQFCESGVINFSAGWFAQGHEVCADCIDYNPIEI